MEDTIEQLRLNDVYLRSMGGSSCTGFAGWNERMTAAEINVKTAASIHRRVMLMVDFISGAAARPL
jgi:hypothetical protein